MIVGFTGTKHGMTDAQLRTVASLFEIVSVDVLHHGVCIGSDAQAHALALRLKAKRYQTSSVTTSKIDLFTALEIVRDMPASAPRIIGHPPVDTARMADLAGFFQMWHPFHFLTRNRHIIEQSTDGIIACPRGFIEPASTRGEGTWTTVSYARKARRHLWIVNPDGVIREERP